MTEIAELQSSFILERQVFDMREKKLRLGVVACKGNQEQISVLVRGDQFEIERLTSLYKSAAQEVSHIKRAFAHHGMTDDLESVVEDQVLTHLAWQSTLDLEFRKARLKKKFYRGPVATRLADTLLMAVK